MVLSRQDTFTSGAHMPANYTRLRSAQLSNIVPLGTTSIQLAGNRYGNLSAPAVATWSIRNAAGVIVASGGSIAAAGSLPISAVSNRCGWYRAYLYGSNGAYQGGGQFIVTRPDARFPNVPTPAGDGIEIGDAGYRLPHRLMYLGERLSVNDMTNPSASWNQMDAHYADQKTYYLPYDNVRRPKNMVGNFTYYNAGQQANIGATVTRYPDILWWEAKNEPIGAGAGHGGAPDGGYVSVMQEFRTAVKAANPSALVVGPCPVSNNQGSTGNIDAFFTAGGGAHCDAISFHTYNSHVGDLTLGRRVWDAWVALLVKHGQQNKLRIITEAGGFFAQEYGAGTPFRQAQQLMLDILLAEQYGVDKERYHYFYGRDIGFGDYPSHMSIGFNGQPYAGAGMLLTHSQEVWGMQWESRLDFGTEDNHSLIGSTYRAANGKGLVSLLGAGRRDISVRLQITGPAQKLKAVDCWGNESFVPVVAGFCNVTVTTYPSYLQLPAGCQAYAVATNRWDQIRTGTVTNTGGSGGSTQIDSVASGSYKNKLFFNGANVDADTESIWRSGVNFNPASPDVLTNVFAGGAQLINRVRLHCPPPWQSQTVVLKATVQARISGTWTTVANIDREPLVLNQISTDQEGYNSFYESFWDDEHVYVLDFAAVTADAIRLQPSKISYGGAPTFNALKGYGATWQRTGTGIAVGDPIDAAGMGTEQPRLMVQRFDAAYGTNPAYPRGRYIVKAV